MVIGIGTDIVQIDRIAKVLERQGDKFTQRILTLTEQQEFARLDNGVAFLAKRFAAKEAVAKALGTGIGHGVSFQDITVINDNKGAPAISLSGCESGVVEPGRRGAVCDCLRYSDLVANT